METRVLELRKEYPGNDAKLRHQGQFPTLLFYACKAVRLSFQLSAARPQSIYEYSLEKRWVRVSNFIVRLQWFCEVNNKVVSSTIKL
jgi:hypothetical protein